MLNSTLDYLQEFANSLKNTAHDVINPKTQENLWDLTVKLNSLYKGFLCFVAHVSDRLNLFNTVNL